MDKRELLKQCPLFSNLSPKTSLELDKIVQQQKCNAGELLFSEGEAAEAFYLLADGEIDLIKSTPDGKEKLIRSLKAGDSFAEAAMLAGENYPATAMVRAKSTLFYITKDNFLNLISRDPDLSLKMMASMAKLLRHLNRLVAELSLGTVAKRLAGFLLKKSEETGPKTFELGMKKQELAFQLGTISETLSRNLNRFKKLGLIEVDGSRISIKDMDRLKNETN